MNILMILSKPFITDSRVRKEAESLEQAGHHVRLIVWDRLNQYSQREWVNGINVIRIQNKGFLRVLPGVLVKNPLWWRKAFKRSLKLFYDEWKFDVVHCHDLDTLQAGIWIKKKTGCKLIYDAHELFGYMILNKPKLISKFALWLENTLIHHVDGIITVNDKLESYFESISSKPISIVMNCSNYQIQPYEKPTNETFTICYIGSLVQNRMFPEIVDIIGHIKDVKFLVAGKKEGLYKEVEERCKLYKNVEFLGTIPSKEIYPTMKKSNALICMLDQKNRNDQVTTPIKMFDAMVVGRPIIVTINMYYSSIIIDDKCGLATNHNDTGIKQAILLLKNESIQEELGKNGLKAASEKYNWKQQEKELLKSYEFIASS